MTDIAVQENAGDAALRAHLFGSAQRDLLAEASALRNAGHGLIQSYSPKVFIPLTKLCRDYCHYCTFSRPLDVREKASLTPNEILAIARDGAEAGCTEALFTLGDKPELRHAAAREALAELGYSSTIAYLVAMCALVLKETGLLPHVNAGVMGREDLVALRGVSASQGLMLETVSDRLGKKGGAHYQSPDKVPAARLETLRLAGELAIPFTSGILIGIVDPILIQGIPAFIADGETATADRTAYHRFRRTTSSDISNSTTSKENRSECDDSTHCSVHNLQHKTSF